MFSHTRLGELLRDTVDTKGRNLENLKEMEERWWDRLEKYAERKDFSCVSMAKFNLRGLQLEIHNLEAYIIAVAAAKADTSETYEIARKVSGGHAEFRGAIGYNFILFDDGVSIWKSPNKDYLNAFVPVSLAQYKNISHNVLLGLSKINDDIKALREYMVKSTFNIVRIVGCAEEMRKEDYGDVKKH